MNKIRIILTIVFIVSGLFSSEKIRFIFWDDVNDKSIYGASTSKIKKIVVEYKIRNNKKNLTDWKILNPDTKGWGNKSLI